MPLSRTTYYWIGGGLAALLLLYPRKVSALSGAPKAVTGANGQWWGWPVPSNARLASSYGCRPDIPGIVVGDGSKCSLGYNWHNGIDLAAPYRTPIFAAASGTVSKVTYDKTNGNYLVITHSGGWDSRYAHCAAIYVSVGERVQRGQLIAAMGSTGASTGSHVHFMTCYNGASRDPQSVIESWR